MKTIVQNKLSNNLSAIFKYLKMTETLNRFKYLIRKLKYQFNLILEKTN